MSWISDVKHDMDKLDLSFSSLKKFGLTVGTVFLLLFSWFIAADIFTFLRWFCFGAGVILLSGGIFFPSNLKSVYKFWMGIAFVLGWIVSRVILTLLFFLILTPVAFLAKLTGKKFLDLEWGRKSNSAWIKKDEETNYEKMF
jgi:hypothetical protein